MFLIFDAFVIFRFLIISMKAKIKIFSDRSSKHQKKAPRQNFLFLYFPGSGKKPKRHFCWDPECKKKLARSRVGFFSHLLFWKSKEIYALKYSDRIKYFGAASTTAATTTATSTSFSNKKRSQWQKMSVEKWLLSWCFNRPCYPLVQDPS